jgi:DNA-binding response OmpR family regulator
MLKLLYVSGDEASSQEALNVLGSKGYHAVCAATSDHAERLLSETPFRVVIIGLGFFHRQKAALAALAKKRSPAVILICTDPSDHTIDADLYVDQVEGEPGILRAVQKACTGASYDVTV